MAETILVPVHRGSEVAAWALVDEADAAVAGAHRWVMHSNGYVITGTSRVYLHRLLSGLAKGDAGTVDHINGDKLDNRRSNLRVVSQGINSQNRHYPLRGAHLHKLTGKWAAMIKVGPRRYYLGLYDTQEAAARVAAEARATLMPGSLEYLARSQSETAL